ncbi:MAG: DUF4344 domain-containing metallopeptidase [Pseudomonadota bacterium]
MITAARNATSCALALSLIADGPAQAGELSAFSLNVTRHVLYHELAHALIREFDLPVLANEEAMADSFAVLAVMELHRDDVEEIVLDRVRSWLYEDAQSDPSTYNFRSEHDLDIRRAYQAACLFYGLDPNSFRDAVGWLDFTTGQLADCSDTAPDQQEGWQSIVYPKLLPDDGRSEKVTLSYGGSPLDSQVQASGVFEDFAAVVARFDWPEPVTILFAECRGGASWSRSTRTIRFCDSYLRRFIDQGIALGRP